jgi:hypothetical protein
MMRVRASLDLWDYDAVKTNSAQILRKVRGGDDLEGQIMPTERTGGPWPSEWISLFDRWIQGGFGRLSLGIAKNLVLKEDESLGIIHLTCSTDVPATTSGHSLAWFESETIPGDVTSAYRLCILPGESLATPPSSVEFGCGERIDGPIPPEGIAVIDATGTHFVTLS